jgi:DNA-binding PadR family transcriptional regulator
MTERPLNATAASLLGFLHDGPLTGWELVATADERIGAFWSLTRSQVYRELARMARTGLVVAGATGPRDRRPYSLTAAGRAAFRHWAETMPGPEQIRYPLLLAISFGAHVPQASLAAFVAAHRREHRERLATYERALPDVRARGDAHAVAVLDFGIRYERAALGWFETLPPEIAGPPG